MNESLLRRMIKSVLRESERIHGGLADGKTLQDIADKHGVSLSHIKTQMKKGIKVEMEHTDDEKVAREVAMDHLMEDPNYYDKLEKVEKGEC